MLSEVSYSMAFVKADWAIVTEDTLLNEKGIAHYDVLFVSELKSRIG